MLGVVIVDDEALVRVDLRSIIDWESEGCTILGEAENGQRGLEMILNIRPDIVITDIKMPVMGGLEMMRAAKAEYSGAQYICLSSYEEFALLKQAMHLGAADYLLKLELTSEALLSVLNTQKKILQQRSNTGTHDISYEAQASRALSDVLSGMPLSENLSDVLSLAAPAINTKKICAIAIKLALSDSVQLDNRKIEAATIGIIKDISKGYFDGITFCAKENLYLFIYTPKQKSSVAEMGRVIINVIHRYLNTQSAVGVGKSVGSFEDIKEIMESAITATEEAFYSGYGSVFHSLKPSQNIESGDSEWTFTLRQALELQDTDSLQNVFNYVDNLMKKRISRNEAHNLCFTVIFMSLSALKWNKKSKELYEENIYETIINMDTLEKLRLWMLSFESRLIGIISNISSEKTRDEHLVSAAMHFINQNCRSQINLTMVANHLFISPGYLSHVFKRTANISFVEYVTNAKIEEAKKLLLSSNYKIYEVSEMIGYEDSSYFSKLFQKITGLKPKEYIARNS